MSLPYAIVVPAHDGQLTVEEHAARARLGVAPRRDYVELARSLDAEVMDRDYLEHGATPLARALAARVGRPIAQIVEAYRRRNDFERICLWSDQFGLPVALLHKLTHARSDLVLVSTYLSSPKKAFFLRPFRVHSHLGAIVHYSSAQLEIAANRLRVPRQLLHHAMQSVDDRFWSPVADVGDMICSVGWWEYRDYETLFQAVAGLDTRVEVAVGKTFRAPGARGEEVTAGLPANLPDNVVVHDQLTPIELRALYARARAVVVPIRNVEFDVGATTIGEAMAMGNSVILTRTISQTDFVTERAQGMYVPPADAAALRAKIEWIMNQPAEATRMGKEGRIFAEQHLTIDAYVARVGSIITGLSKGRA